MSFALAGCGGGSQSSPSSSSSSSTQPSSSSSSSSSSEKEPTVFDGTDYYESLSSRVSFDKDNENNIVEEFSSGKMNDDYWNALSGVWQNDSSSYPHNGVQSRNLFYVKNDDKTSLAFKGRGIYSSDEDSVKKNGYTLPEGACIISKNNLGPGRFEIEMAAMPREGGVSAMWTYSTTTGNEATSQNEIDIELGGNTSETFMREWCTTWTKHSSKATENVDVTPICHTNDGKIHKYSFDWYTDYKGTGKARVDWFLDSILIATFSGEGGEVVPVTEMPLWIGLWFPNWASIASFDTDYMLVDSIKYTAFDSSQGYDACRAKSGYTQVSPSKAMIKTISMGEVRGLNKLSNGDFSSLEKAPQDESYMGWVEDGASQGTVSLTDGPSTSKAFLLSSKDNTGDTGEFLMQKISNCYEGYEFTYVFEAKLNEGSEASIEFHYLSIRDKNLKTLSIILGGEGFKTYAGSSPMPENAGHLRVDLVVDKGSAVFSKARLIKTSW